MESLAKKRLFFFIKIAVSLTILWLICRRIDFSQVFASFSRIKISTFALLIILTILKLATQYLNWNRCLSLNSKFKPEKYEIIKSHFIGLALRFLVPGGHATFGKAYFLSNSKKATLFSVGVEKFFQTWTALLFGSLAALFYFAQYALALRLAAVVLALLIPLFIYLISSLLKEAKWKDYFRNFLKTAPSITLSQTIFVLLTITQYYLIINTFNQISFTNLMITVPLILLANIIPISFAGLGVRETFAIHLLEQFGISGEIAVTASLLIFILNSVLPGLVGLWLIIASSRRPNSLQ